MLHISDKKQTFRIKVLDWDTPIEITEGRSNLIRFQEAWEQHEDRFSKPHWGWTAEDFGIAKRLLAKESLDVLCSYLEQFWWYHASPLSQGYMHPLLLFASAIPKIKAEGWARNG